MKSQNTRFLCLILALGIPTIYGIVQEMPTPTELLECLLFKSMNTSVADVPGKSIEDFCLNNYALSQNHGNLQRNISSEGIRYLKSLFRQVEAETRMTRNKRQASSTWRVRQEIRTLSATQRSRIFGCLNRLKRDNVSLLHIIIHVLFEHNYPFFKQLKSEDNQSDFNFYM